MAMTLNSSRENESEEIPENCNADEVILSKELIAYRNKEKDPFR